MMSEHQSILWRETFVVALAHSLKDGKHGDDANAVQRASRIADHAVNKFSTANATRHFRNVERELNEVVRNG